MVETLRFARSFVCCAIFSLLCVTLENSLKKTFPSLQRRSALLTDLVATLFCCAARRVALRDEVLNRIRRLESFDIWANRVEG